MRYLLSFFVLLLMGLSVEVSAQDPSNIDFSKIKVDQLSDQQVQRIAQEIEKRGLTVEQATQLAISRGMSRSEAAKLQRRLSQVQTSATGDTATDESFSSSRQRTNPVTDSTLNTMLSDSLGAPGSQFQNNGGQQDSLSPQERRLRNKIFGYRLFQRQSLNFTPSLNIPTPKNYQLGSGDEIILDIWGAAENTYRLEVSPEGAIIIDNIGPVYVGGLTIEEAKTRLREKLSEIYSGLRTANRQNPDTFMQVALGQIRSIKVTVLGEVTTPGTYTLPSLATVFNALYSSGGPTVDGTFRSIKVIRNDTVITSLDLYDFLIRGKQKNNIRLQDQDVIRIDPYRDRVEVKGEAKRTGIYELKENESLTDLIQFAGGFTGKAYREKINVISNTDTEKKISTVRRPNFDRFDIRNGDEVRIGSILNRFANQVKIEGAVFRPGSYELTDSTSLYSLIQQADGIKGDAFMNRGIIYRTQDDFTIEAISFDVREIIQNPRENDIDLKRDDLVRISSIFDLREDYFVEVEGAVIKPGQFNFVEDMTLEDAIFQSGGFKRAAAPYRIEVARRISEVEEDSLSPSKIAKIFTFSVDESLELDEKESDFTLKPFDKVYIRTTPNFEAQKDVNISGEVQYPGTYSLKDKTERISDLIERAGGLSRDAYLEGATLYRRFTDLAEVEDENAPTGILEGDANTKFANRVTLSKIGIELPEIFKEKQSKYDLFLQEGDSLVIPKQLQTVLVKGGVFYPTSIRYEKGKSYKDYITSAGGFTDLARKNSAYIVYANGDVDRTKSFLFFKDFPNVRPGATIIVPEKPAGAKLTPQERVALYSAIVSTAALITTTVIQIRQSR